MGKNLKYNPEDYVGKKIGKWTVLAYLPEKTKNWIRYVRCRCECGKEVDMPLKGLLRGGAKGCCSCRSTKHGLQNTHIYSIWLHMRRRCYTKTDASYKDYGAKGISICKEWNDFNNFYNWAMNSGYNEMAIQAKPMITRINKNGNYEPLNCKWTNRSEHNINREKLKSNKSGYVGIYWVKRDKRWRVQISVNGKRMLLGSYKIQREALEARNEYIIKNNLPDKIQEYRGELLIMNVAQKNIQEIENCHLKIETTKEE